MNKAIKVSLILGLLNVYCFYNIHAQSTQMSTYCNPLNIDYTYMIYNANDDISYRSGADPAVVRFRGEYYMFVTRSLGYWHSTDLNNWTFITPEKWYFEGSNAPAAHNAHNYKDAVLYVAGNPSGSMSILYTDNPKKGDWKAVPAILHDLQDPALFIDDDGQAYMFWGSSNKFPIRGRKLDKDLRFRPSQEIVELFNLDGERHGWERFGENHSDTKLGGYIEGPWLTKHNNKYYMQYAAPGTEFNVYGDGVYVSDSPLGPYRYAPNNPVAYKPGGFANGTGHGSTVIGPGGQYWHFGTIAVSVNVNWERRISMFPAYFDKDGLMYCNTSFGDYPHFAPAVPGKMGQFAGWMLLSYKKPVKASSSVARTVRYIRYKNIHVPTPNLSISGLRVFGLGQGKAPTMAKNLAVNRYQDRRDAMITWEQQKNCHGYNVLWGIAPDKLYSSWMVYDKNYLELKSLTVDQEYYFAVEAFNENGVSERTKVVKSE
ncbi:MAG: family 43 glycosylhydrolase [Acidobacteria bacterium]|nr:family 43 glycosylhydrolase [Acidobacteriota bacterium]